MSGMGGVNWLDVSTVRADEGPAVAFDMLYLRWKQWKLRACVVMVADGDLATFPPHSNWCTVCSDRLHGDYLWTVGVVHRCNFAERSVYEVDVLFCTIHRYENVHSYV